MNGPMPGFGDAASFGPFVVDPSAMPNDDRMSLAGLLRQANRYIERANEAMASRDECKTKLYLRMTRDMINEELDPQ